LTTGSEIITIFPQLKGYFENVFQEVRGCNKVYVS